MKKGTHPEYYEDATIVCACGHKATVGSTIKELRVELCSACHPFYTGKQNMVDTARRIEKFAQRTGKQEGAAAKQGNKKAKTAKRAAQKAVKKTKKAVASEA
jgi:large subunit ribosomal protein L31